MGISIKKGNTELDVKPGSMITRERQSPFFRKDEVPPEISYPIALPPSDKNLKELGYLDHLPADKTQRQDIILYDDGMQITAGKLQTEYLDTNLRRSNVGSISAFVLSNFSEFLQRISNKKLNQLNLGGLRTFTWDGYDATSGTGFWKHVHDTWQYADSDDGDYVFATIRNEGYLGDATWMNKLMLNGADETEMAQTGNSRSLCPAIFLGYILKQIFLEAGYAVSGDILEDAQFKKAIFPSFYGVFWCTSSFDGAIPPNETVTPLNSITINLQEHVPPEWTIAKFLLELQNKIPIGYDIDDNKKQCRIVLLSSLTGAAAKDRTKEVSSQLRIVLEKEQKIFAFENTIDSNDEYPEGIDLATWNYLGESAADITTMPGDLYLNTILNEYHGIKTDVPFVPGVTVAVKIADNIYGYKPANSTETITTAMSPMPSETVTVFTGTTYGDVTMKVPICKQEGNWKGKAGDLVPWDVRLLFWYGLQGVGATPIMQPVANYHTFGLLGTWSWAYKCGEVGLYDVFWKDWLKTFANFETIEGVWMPTLVDYLTFRWDDVLLIKNTPFLITHITERLPMNGTVAVPFKAKRMGIATRVPVITDDGGTSFVYLQMVWENITDAIHTTYLVDMFTGDIISTEFTNARLANLVVYAWADAAGTIPVSPAWLPFNMRWIWNNLICAALAHSSLGVIKADFYHVAEKLLTYI
jgi:hypothetical protein